MRFWMRSCLLHLLLLRVLRVSAAARARARLPRGAPPSAPRGGGGRGLRRRGLERRGSGWPRRALGALGGNLRAGLDSEHLRLGCRCGELREIWGVGLGSWHPGFCVGNVSG